MAFRNYVLLITLVVGVISGPINVQDGDMKCAKTCTESLSDNAKFQYTPGTTYTYTYEGTTETKLQGSSEQTTTLAIGANCDIEVLSKCEWALRLRDVTLKENGVTSASSYEFKQKLEANTLRFGFQDGRIDDVCSMSAEDDRVLNVKKGVLSAFQNTMERLDTKGQFTETDVSGRCQASYQTEESVFSGITIRKSKDLLSCTERNGNISSIHSERYRVPSKIQGLPLTKGNYECTQHIKSNRLESSKCTEVLTFRPFSSGNSGAVTTATQVMTYKTYRNSVTTTQGPIQHRTNMLFQHSYDESIDSAAKSEVISLLTEICNEVSEDITKETPIMFGALISKMKKLSSERMMQVYQAVNSGRICSSVRGKQFFFDAIPFVATEASLAMTEKLISEKTIQGAEAEMWLTQLAFIPRPTYQMLRSIKPLLSDATLKTKAMLGVSAMVHKICEQNSDCQANSDIADFVTMLNSNIGSDCSSSTPEQREDVLITLKAIGNAGNSMTSSSIIGRCITNKKLDTEMRVAALQAYRRMPCTASREDAMRIYQNADLDAELRIHAFLAVMTCPTSSVLTKVKMMLSGEPVNQVGSFVWTYLENVKETSSPLRQDLSAILQDAKLREDFNCDVRKFSRNVEKSFFSDYLNAGAQAESNVIFSQRSYIPRSAMLNLTVDMFGNSVNLLEVGGRVQGLEKLIEKFFGPNGYFSMENTKELMENKRQTAANHISPFDTLFKTPEDKMSGSMYIKMFGNEIKYMGLNSDSDFNAMKNFNILEFLIKLAEPKKVDLTKNFQFMDTSVIIPTIIGLPMNLTVNGTASVSIDMNGKLDVRDLGAVDISGYIKPSAAIVVSGIMGVDAIVTKSSMKMVATMHTSTQLNGKVELLNGQVFNVEMNMPRDKMEVFHVQSEFFMNGKKMVMPAAATVIKRCSGPTVTKVVGLEMCVDIELPAYRKSGLPLPPFTGPMNAQFTVEKKDTHTGYSFTAKYENQRQRLDGSTYTKRSALISLDTPGSQIDRKLEAKFDYDPIKMAVDTSVITPWKKLAWTGSVMNRPDLKKAVTTFTIDGTQEYSTTAQLDITSKRVKTVYSPSFIVKIPNKPTMTISGTFETGTGKTLFSTDLKINKFTARPIAVSGSITQAKGGKNYGLEWKVKSDLINSDIDGSVDISQGSYIVSTALAYTVQNRPEHRFSVSGKFNDKSQGKLMSYSTQLGFITTEFPQLTFSFDGDYQMTDSHIESKLKLTHGQNKDVMTFAHRSSKRGTIDNLSVDCTTSFKCPSLGIDFSKSLEHKHSPTMLDSSLEVTYAPGKTVKGEVKLDNKMDTEKRMDGSVSVNYLGREMLITTDFNKLTDGEYKHNLLAKWGDGDQKMNIASSLKTGDTHVVSSEIKLPGHPITLTASIKPNPKDFMVRADITYRRDTYAAETAYKYEPDRLTGSAQVTLPSRKVMYSVELTRANRDMSMRTQLKWDAGRDDSKMVSVVGELKNRGTSYSINREATLTTVTPSNRLSTRLYMDRTDTTANMEAELAINERRSDVTFSYDLTNGFSGKAKLKSPYIQYGPVKSIAAIWDVTRTTKGYTSSAEFSWDDQHKVTQLSTYTWTQSRLTYSMDVTTPFLRYSRLGFNIDAAKGSSYIMKIYREEQEGIIKFTHTGFSAAMLAVNLQGVCDLSTSFNAQTSAMTAEAKYSWADDKKIWSKVDLNIEGPITATLDITTPFTYKKLSASINHEGSYKRFNTQAAVSWNDEQIRSIVKFSPTESKVTVNTPWRMMEASYDVEGTLKAFNGKALLQWAADKKVSSEMTFNMMDDISMTFKMATPFTSNINGNFEISGPIDNFNHKMALTYAPGQTISATSTFSLRNGINAEATLTTPFEAVRDVKLIARHTGNMQAWDNSASLTINRRAPIVIYSERKSDKLNTIKIGMKNVPCEKIQQWELKGEYRAFSAKTTTRLTATWNNDQTIFARVIYAFKNGYDLSATFTSPFTEEIQADIKHTGSTSVFTNSATVSWSSTKKIALSSQLDMSRGVDAKFELDSPWKKISAGATRKGNAKELTADTFLTWDNEQTISSTLQFSQYDEIKGKWTLKTPFQQARNIAVQISHSGNTYKKFNNVIEASMNGKKATLGTTFDVTSGFVLKVNSVNPWQEFNIMIEHRGTSTDFTTEASYDIAGQTFSGKLDFAMRDNIEVRLELKNPTFYQPITATANLGFENSRVTMTWGNYKTITAETSLDMSGGLSATAKFTTPFAGYESGMGKLMHTGNMKAFTNSIEVTFQDKTFQMKSMFSSRSSLEGSIEMTTPWNNYKASFNHSGNMIKFNNHAEVTWALRKTITIDTEWDMSRGISATSKMVTPFEHYTEMQVMYNHVIRNNGELSAHAELSCSRHRITSDLTFKLNPTILAELSFNSPWKSFSGKYTHQGTFAERCNAHVELTWDKKDMTADWSISTINGLQTELTISTPWRNVAAEIKHTGPWNNFDQIFSVTYDTGRTIRLKNDFSMISDIVIKSSLTSPFKNAQATFRHSGDMKRFTCELDAEYERMPVTANLKWDMMNGYETSIDIRSPWRNIDAEFKTNKDPMNLAANGSFKWDSDKQIEAIVRFNKRTGSITVNTPWRNLVASFDHSGDLSNMRSSAEFSWESGKQIKTEVTFKKAPLSGSWTINTPWRNMAANFDHSGDLSNMRSSAEFSWESGKQIKTEVTFKKAPLSGSWTINTPWRNMAANFENTGDLADMKASADFSWETGKKIKMDVTYMKATYAATWSLQTPWQNFAAKMSHTGHSSDNLNCSYEFSWGPSKKVSATVLLENSRQSGIDGKFNIYTPWRNIAANVKHDGSYNRYVSHADFSWDSGKQVSTDLSLNLDPMSAEWTVRIPSRTLTAKFSYEKTTSKIDTSAEFSWSPSQKIRAEFDFEYANGFQATASVVTPWRNVNGRISHTGVDYKKFTNSASFSWETDKTISTEVKFNMMNGMSGEAKLITPFTEELKMVANFDGTRTDFTSSASFAWAPTKTISATASFKMADRILGSAEINTPFTETWTLTFDHSGDMQTFTNEAELSWAPGMKITAECRKTTTSCECNLMTPFTAPIKFEYKNLRDMYNWEAKVEAMNKKISAESRWTMGTGYNGEWKINTNIPKLRELAATVSYNGDRDNVVHDATIEWNNQLIKSTTKINRPEASFSQVIETPFAGYEKLELSAEYDRTETSFSTKWMAAKNTEIYELNVQANVVYKKYKISTTGSIQVKTPFTNFEDNKISTTADFSQRLYDVQFEGYMGNASNQRMLQFYSMKRGEEVQAHIKSNLYSGAEESLISISYSLDGDKLTVDYFDDIKPLEHSCKLKMTVSNTRTDSVLNHNGKIDVTYNGKARTFEWNAGSNHYMCETGFTYSAEGRALVTYTHKTTWTNYYEVLNHQMAYKCSKYDAAFKMEYDFSNSMKTVSVSMFTDPSKPWDMKMEFTHRGDIHMMIEMSTPLEALRTMKTIVQIQKTSKPWTATIDSTLNGKKTTAVGTVNYNGMEDMEGSLMFTSKIPMFEELHFTIKNAKLQNTWRPNMSMQWASNKKIDLSGTFEWGDQYKSTIDLSTPFESMRSVVASATLNCKMPDSLHSEFSFKTSKMARELIANLDYSKEAKTFSMTMSSPWRTVNSMEISASMTPRIAVTVTYNGRNLFNLSGNGSWTNWQKNNIDVQMTYPFWNQYMSLKMNNDLSLKGDKSMIMDLDFEYMRGKPITFKYTHRSSTQTNVDIQFTSPFEKLENIKYSVVWSGAPDNWTENTIFEYYAGKYLTSTRFSMLSGITWHQTVTGQMKNGEDFNLQKDFIFKGDPNKFDMEASFSGSHVPTVKFSTNWQYEPTKLALRTNWNKYSLEYTHEGGLHDFTCTYKAVIPGMSSYWGGESTQTWSGNWTIKTVDRLTVNARFTCPHYDVKVNVNSSFMDGTVAAELTAGSDRVFKYDASFKRSTYPYNYEGESHLIFDGHTYSTSAALTNTKATLLAKYDTIEILGLRVSNIKNADGEYEPKITFKISNTEGESREYEFDGLYKNEGEGLVRDFKLHINGPRGFDSGRINFQLNFQTQSSQLVPGDLMFHLGYYKQNGQEQVLTHFTADWGNDKILVTFTEPRPMKYGLDFTVSTKGISGEIVANWDTDAVDKKFKVNFENKMVVYSRRFKHLLDVDIEYLGVTRGIKSNMDWQTKTFNHRLTFDYNNKEVGYDIQLNHVNGCADSIEVLTPWRSVKTSWISKPIADGFDYTYSFWWDSQNDQSKKFNGQSVMKKLGYHNYQWTTTVSHPSLAKEITITDTIVYNTDTTVFDFNKKFSFSADPTKDVIFDMSLLKNHKWGVSLKQLYNNIDIRIGTEFTQGSNAAVSHTQLQYKGTDGRMKTIALRAAYNTPAKTASFEFETPIKTIKIESETTSISRGAWTTQITTTVDGKAYRTIINYKPAEVYVQVKVEYDPMNNQNYLNFEAKKLSTGYQVKLIKQHGSETTIEGLAAVSLNESKTFNTKLFWNPALYSEVKEKITTLRGELKELVKKMHSASKIEAANKVQSLQLGNDFDQIMPYHKTEWSRAKADVQRFQRGIARAYNNDVMGMKTIAEASSVYIIKIADEFEVLKEKMTAFYNKHILPYSAKVTGDVKMLTMLFAEKLLVIENKIKDLKHTYNWIDQTEAIAKALDNVAEWLQLYYDRIAEYTSGHPTMDSLRQFHANAMTSFNQYSTVAADKISGMANPAIYAPYMSKAQTYVKSAIPSEKLGQVTDVMKNKLAFYYHYYDIADNTQIFIKHAKNIAAEYMDYWLTHFVDQTLNDFKWITYEPDMGRIEFEVTVPTQFTDIDLSEFKEELKEKLQGVMEHLRDYHFNVKELFYMYKPRSIGQIMPPYDTHAIIAGQHIRTFDRRHYDFSGGRCSYLLARDFVDGNFTVYMNYDGEKQSLSVHSNGRLVEIMQDNTVKMDGGKIELPVQFYNTSIKLVGHTISLENKLGVKVICDNKHGLCTIWMSGFYFAKTGGLLGTYNNEPLDDFTTSRNKNVTDVTKFANSWALERCSSTNKAKVFTPVENTKEYSACAAMFKDSSSPMQSCFAVVDPEPHFHKCVNDMSLDVTSTAKNGPCKAAVFYKTECSMSGVSVSVPAHCVSCDLGDATIERGEERQLPAKVNAADVVIVVEEKMCNFNTDKKLPQLVKYVQAALKNQKYSDVRFGLVGFGGVGVHDPAHIHTMSSKEFASATDFVRGSEALTFGTGENKDVFEAIEFAAQYPFRAGASKVIVVIPCSDCSESAVSVSYLARKLNSEGVSVHMISEFTFETPSGRNPSTNYLFGIDNRAVFSMRDSTTLKGSTKLYSAVTKPKDQCSYLALQTDGTIFNLNMMTKMRSYIIKNFQNVFANRMALSTTPSTCQICSCEYNSRFMEARTVCKKC